MADFMIDNIEMPKPDEWATTTELLSSSAGRLPGSGKMVIEYLSTTYKTEWKYKLMTGAEFDTVYDAYVKSCKTNKSFEHSFKTLSSIDGSSLSYTMYTQNEVAAPLYMIKNGVRYYKDVTFTFVGVGGDE